MMMIIFFYTEFFTSTVVVAPFMSLVAAVEIFFFLFPSCLFLLVVFFLGGLVFTRSFRRLAKGMKHLAVTVFCCCFGMVTSVPQDCLEKSEMETLRW